MLLSNGTGGAGAPANLSRNQTDPFGRNEEVAQMEIGVLSLTFVAAVLGNVSVLVVTRRLRRRSRMHLFMTHLSLADLVVAFFQVLPQLCWDVTFRFHGPDFLCRVVKHLQVAGMFASAYMTVAVTLDRYIAICHPLWTLRRPAKRARAMIGLTWGASLALSAPQYLIFSLSEVSPGSAVYDCWGHFVEPWGPRAYVTWMAVGVFLVPVAALVFCYGFICRTVWRNLKDKTQRKSAEAPASSVSRAKLRTVKMTFVIVLAYVLCWTPFFTVQMWSVWDRTFSWDDTESTAVTLSALLASLNSCCNPWIYLLFSGHLPCCPGFSPRASGSGLRRTTMRSHICPGPETPILL